MGLCVVLVRLHRRVGGERPLYLVYKGCRKELELQIELQSSATSYINQHRLIRNPGGSAPHYDVLRVHSLCQAPI